MATRALSMLGLLVLPTLAIDPAERVLFLDSRPLYVEASVVTVTTDSVHTTDDKGSTLLVAHPATTLRVDCGSDDSPENDACRDASIYPATAAYTILGEGMAYEGTTTYRVDNSTTTWSCDRAGADDSISCVKTIASGGSTRTESTTHDSCYVWGHMVPAVLTAGLDKMGAPPPTEYPVDDKNTITLSYQVFNSDYSQIMSRAGCPATKAAIWDGAATTAAADGGEGSDDENAGVRPVGSASRSLLGGMALAVLAVALY